VGAEGRDGLDEIVEMDESEPCSRCFCGSLAISPGGSDTSTPGGADTVFLDALRGLGQKPADVEAAP